MKKVVSFSVYGDAPIYNVGAIRNAELMESVYPEWSMIVYHDDTTPDETITELQKLNVQTIDMSHKNIFKMFWRYYIIDDKTVEHSIFRDSDSRISEREANLVQEWIEQDKSLHVIRDHPAHKICYGSYKKGMLGGMWGIKNERLDIKISSQLDKHDINVYGYGSDQTYIHQIYDYYLERGCDMTEHDFCNHLNRENPRFIGERIGVDEQPTTNDWRSLV